VEIAAAAKMVANQPSASAVDVTPHRHHRCQREEYGGIIRLRERPIRAHLAADQLPAVRCELVEGHEAGRDSGELYEAGDQGHRETSL